AVVVALREHLPVGVDAVPDPSGGDADPTRRREVAEAVEEIPSVRSEMVVERSGVAARVREDEAAVAADPPGAVEPERRLRLVQAARQRHALQLAGERERPAVIRALQRARVAARADAEPVAAMGAAVGED